MIGRWLSYLIDDWLYIILY